MRELLYPEETDPEVIQSMAAVAFSQPGSLPIMVTLLATHHVNRFMFTTDGTNTELRRQLLSLAQGKVN